MTASRVSLSSVRCVGFFCGWLAIAVAAQESPAPPATAPALASGPDEEATHQELRSLRASVVEAMNQANVDALVQHLDEHAIITWQNSELSRGPAGFREYYTRMMTGPNRVVSKLTIKPEVDDKANLYGNTAFAVGHSDDTFTLTDGREFTVATRWSATVVKNDGRWRIVGVHLSANMFDNPILKIAVQETAKWTGIIAVLLGLVVGGVIGRWLTRSKPA